MFAAASALFFVGCATVQEPVTSAWEHKVVKQYGGHPTSIYERNLNELGDKGWVVASSSTIAGVGDAGTVVIILKRPKNCDH